MPLFSPLQIRPCLWIPIFFFSRKRIFSSEQSTRWPRRHRLRRYGRTPSPPGPPTRPGWWRCEPRRARAHFSPTRRPASSSVADVILRSRTHQNQSVPAARRRSTPRNGPESPSRNVLRPRSSCEPQVRSRAAPALGGGG